MCFSNSYVFTGHTEGYQRTPKHYFNIFVKNGTNIFMKDYIEHEDPIITTKRNKVLDFYRKDSR